MSTDKKVGEQQVLSPWADADPVPARGITERLDDLNGKKIGLFCNVKRAAHPMLQAAEKWMSKHFPKTEISWYRASVANVPELESKRKEKFEKWVDSIDAAILAVGD